MSVSPFVVHVASMRRNIGARENRYCVGEIADLSCSGSAVPVGADVEADVVLESISGAISVTGSVRAPWVGTCRRCLSTASGDLDIRVRELYTSHGDGDETYPLVDDTVDLEPMVRDAVLLELPLVPLCRVDCRGLCPNCGAALDDGDCGCQAPPDPRWAALDLLRTVDLESEN